MPGQLGRTLASLGFRHAWCIDFEFVAPPGHKPKPICLVAKCAITGQVVRLWRDELSSSPFDVADDVLFTAYYASAESSCFDVLGWSRPRRMLDLFAEFRCLTNGAGAPHGNGLIGALLHYSLPTIGGKEKDAMRKLILGGGPWSNAEAAQIVAYCKSDVDALLRLLETMLPIIATSPIRFGQALLSGALYGRCRHSRKQWRSHRRVALCSTD
jgi:DNA polymerase I